MENIDREILKKLLKRWQSDKIDAEEIFLEAEKMWTEYENQQDFPKKDYRSIGDEVLSTLDSLNVQLITKDDIPIMLNFLDTLKGKESEAWAVWEKYWDSVDLELRKTSLKGRPYCM